MTSKILPNLEGHGGAQVGRRAGRPQQEPTVQDRHHRRRRRRRRLRPLGGQRRPEEERQLSLAPRVKVRAGHFRYFLICSIIKNDFLPFLSS